MGLFNATPLRFVAHYEHFHQSIDKPWLSYNALAISGDLCYNISQQANLRASRPPVSLPLLLLSDLPERLRYTQKKGA